MAFLGQKEYLAVCLWQLHSLTSRRQLHSSSWHHLWKLSLHFPQKSKIAHSVPVSSKRHPKVPRCTVWEPSTGLTALFSLPHWICPMTLTCMYYGPPLTEANTETEGTQVTYPSPIADKGEANIWTLMWIWWTTRAALFGGTGWILHNSRECRSHRLLMLML